MKLGYFLVTVAMFSPSVAAATDFPIFYPNVFCKAFGAANSQYPNGIAEKVCLSNEQEAYDEARYLWPQADDAAKQYCSAMANKPPGRDHVPYELLSQCLSIHAQQGRLMNQGVFKY